MFVTDDFAFVHIPKTGGTFVRQCLMSLLERGPIDRLAHGIRRSKRLPKYMRVRLPFYPYRYWEVGSQHSFLRHLPPQYRRLVKLSCKRSPLSLYRSHYTFGWWASNPSKMFIDEASRNATLNDNLTFEDFVKYFDEYGNWSNHQLNKHRVGNLSAEFIFAFTEEHQRADVFNAYPNVDEMVAVFRDVTTNVKFLSCEWLSTELADFLRERGLPADDCNWVAEQRPINMSKTRRVVTIEAATESYIREREQFLFRLFPEYDRAPCLNGES